MNLWKPECKLKCTINYSSNSSIPALHSFMAAAQLTEPANHGHASNKN